MLCVWFCCCVYFFFTCSDLLLRFCLFFSFPAFSEVLLQFLLMLSERIVVSASWSSYHGGAADSRRQHHVTVVTVGFLVVTVVVVLAQRRCHLFMAGWRTGLHQSHTGEHCLTTQQASLPQTHKHTNKHTPVITVQRYDISLFFFTLLTTTEDWFSTQAKMICSYDRFSKCSQRSQDSGPSFFGFVF